MRNKEIKKLIFITGGVVSSLGKGIFAASLAQLLQNQGIKVFPKKLDPYLNIDAGKMNPYQHGEVYVTTDGFETDLDLGHYERFLNTRIKGRYASVTSGMIYKRVLQKERQGLYRGQTVQIIPQVVNEIKELIFRLPPKKKIDIQIIEVGGTVGDIESLAFTEALRQIKNQYHDDVIFIHLVLIPFLKISGEFKTKPAQHSLKTLLSLGIQPQIIICRSEKKISDQERNKLSLFSNLEAEKIFNIYDCPNVYLVPAIIREQKIDKLIAQMLKIKLKLPKNNFIDKENFLILKTKKKIIVNIVGKYGSYQDNYLSISEGLKLAALKANINLEINFIDVEKLDEHNIKVLLSKTSGIILAGGFGEKKIAQKIFVAKYARIQKIPFLGICLGMQIACIEYARNVMKLTNANSIEFDENTSYPIFIFNKKEKLFLGDKKIYLENESQIKIIYQKTTTLECFRNRYHFNKLYERSFQDNNFSLVAFNENKEVVALELPLKEHPFFLVVQYHLEFNSSIKNPHPLFVSFLQKIREINENL